MIVGITGHQVIGDAATVAWVRKSLDQQIRQHYVTLGLSSLALGTDQLFVNVLRGTDIPFEAVIPCALYDETFTSEHSRSTYLKLLSVAQRVHHLPYTQPNEEAFFAAGKWIVAHCDLLLAVWNGLPARGLGGAADVVAVAMNSHRAWVHIDPIKKTVALSG